MTSQLYAKTSQFYLPVRGQPLASLVVLASPEADEHALQFILLSQPAQKVTIGRSPECTIVLKDSTISWSHVSLEVIQSPNGPSLKVQNLSTKESATLIGDKPLGFKVDGLLQNGDLLRLGNTELRYVHFNHEAHLEKQLEAVNQLAREGQHERALSFLQMIQKHRLIHGLNGTSLERLLRVTVYQEAWLHAIQGKWNRAIELFGELASPGNIMLDLRIRAAFQLGTIYLQKNDLEKAQALIDSIWPEAEPLSYNPENGYSLALLRCLHGMTLARQRDLSAAQAAFKEATTHLQGMLKPSKTLSSRILLEQAIAAFLSDQLDLALNQLERLTEEMDLTDKLKVIRGEALRYRGIIHSRRRNFEEADTFLRDAVQIFQDKKWKFLECKAQKSRAINYHSWGRLEEATVHLQLSQKLLETEVENQYEHAVVAAHLGKIYLTRGDAHEALRWFEVERSRQAGISGIAHSQAYTHQNFARAYRNLGRREEATQYYMLAARMFGEFSNFVPQGLTLIELCRHRLEGNDVPGASADLASAEQCFATVGRSRDFTPMMDTVRAQIAYLKGQEDKALSLFTSSITALESSAPSYFLGETYLIYGRIRSALHQREAQRGDTDAARLHQEEAKRLFSKGIDCAAHQGLGYLAEQFRKEIESLDPKEFVKLILSRFVGSEPLDQLVNKSFQELNASRIEERTVLFVDLCGYTAMAERENLNELRDTLNEFYGFATRIIQQHGGMVDKFIGDCVMAFFKGPMIGGGDQNQALAAVNAATTIVVEVERLSERRFSNSRMLRASAGICTGKLLVGMLGSLQHMNYTCIGDVVNVAARLQGLAKPGQVLIASETYRAYMGSGAPLISEGPLTQQVKNRSKPVQYWSVDPVHSRRVTSPTR
jgi:class 3 adenylate cyclase/pSer/pThr/pTyr-binding forkhead associated (FHA) protein